MTVPSRRTVLAGLAATAVPAGLAAQAQDGRPPPFRFEDVARRAREIAAAPYEPPPPLAAPLDRLDPTALAAIRFRPERALLGSRGGPFRMQLFHAGTGGASRPATVNVVRDGIATPIPYQSALFEAPGAGFERLPVNLGFAGLRLHAALNDPRTMDEFAAFLGPGELRVLGRGDRYGLAARALLADLGGEDPPAVREYWVDLPGEGADAVTVHALLDGPSLAAAYRFRIRPGPSTEVEVRAAITPRRPLAAIGIAPLLSSFRVGEADPRPAGEYRPEVHDSDGLLLHAGGGEWLWRPLRASGERRVSAFVDRDPRGFGLLQRDRRFESYQDLDAAFERRPGYWIEPDGGWGEGQVVLVEEAAAARNVTVSWQPREAFAPGREVTLGYRLRTVGAAEALHPGGRCINTFQSGEGASQNFLVDFAGGDLAYHLAEPGGVEVVATTNAGSVAARVEPNRHVGGFRASLEARLDGPVRAADLRAYLKSGGRALTETWTMPWSAA